MSEKWRPVPGWETLYEVSDQGQVRSLGAARPHWQGGVAYHKPRVLKQSNQRYRAITLMHNRRKVSRMVHIIVADAFLPERPSRTSVVRHRDGNCWNNAASNLMWGTDSQNIHDEVQHGTHRNSRKTHCPNKHPLADPNLYRAKGPRGSVTARCRACNIAFATLRNRGVTSPRGHALFQVIADVKCDEAMPAWRDWTPPEGFRRSA